jgi:DNA-binding CsgD family transcriptional regulator
MEQTTDAARQLLVVRHSLHSAIVEHRFATEELKAVTRELENVLLDMATKAGLGLVPPAAEGVLEPSVDGHHEKIAALAKHSVSELKREVDRSLRKGRETVREAAAIRQRAAQFRAALRNHTGGAAGPNNGGDGHSNEKAGRQISRREKQVLALMVEGKSSKEIAAALGISFKTAVTHRASIMGKLDVHEIASVVREAIRRGLV